jgi:hypothetical protein
MKLKQKGGPGYVEVASVQIQSVGEWNEALDTIVDLHANPELRTITTLVAELDSVVQTNLGRLPEAQDLDGVLRKYDAVRNAVNSVYPGVIDPRNKKAIQSLQVRLEIEQKLFFENKAASTTAAPMANTYFTNLTDVEKRFYRLNENYRPEVYRKISSLCDSSAAIVKRNTASPAGSGVLVGDNLVLTAKHIIEDNAAKTFDASEYTVWFDFEETLFSKSPDRVEFDTEEVYRSKTLDFMLLRLRSQPATNGFPSATSTATPSATPPATARTRLAVPLCSCRVGRWSPIILFGYPQGSKHVVHDSGWVLFPHRLLSNSERGVIESEITDDFFDPAGPGSFDDRMTAARDNARRFLILYYGPFEKENADGYSFIKDDMPCVGVEADLFEGDSGAPAILRENGKLIGILTQGPKDIPGQSAVSAGRKVPIAARAGAKFHERLLPATAIIDDLKNNRPDLLSLLQVVP